MNQLECVVETIRFALNSLSTIIPDWIANQLPPDWKNRYGPRAEDFRLPKSSEQRNQYAQQIGLDGYWLMDCLDGHQQASFLWQIPAVDLLRRVWLQHFQLTDDQVKWRTDKEGGLPPSAKFISSPYDGCGQPSSSTLQS
jgi:transposase